MTAVDELPKRRIIKILQTMEIAQTTIHVTNSTLASMIWSSKVSTQTLSCYSRCEYIFQRK